MSVASANPNPNDPGPTVLPGAFTIGAGQTADLSALIASLIEAGRVGDRETVTSLGAGAGSGVLQTDPQGHQFIGYVAPATGGSDTIAFTVQDQNGLTAQGSIAVTVDPGPIALDPTLVVAHGRPLDLSALVHQLAQPGLAADTLTLVQASVASGSVTEANGQFYVAASSQAGGDALTYTVADQYGDTAQGTAVLQIDPGPTVAVGVVDLAPGQTLNLSSEIASLITPGLPGDTETIGNIQAVAGQIVTVAGEGLTEYVAPAGGTDTVTFTVTDQAGDVATGHLDIVTQPGATGAGGGGAGAGKALPGDDLRVTLAPGTAVSLSTLLGDYVTEAGTGDPLTITAVRSAQGASVAADAGAWSYAAPAGGSDVVSYTATDAAGHILAGVIDVSVDPGVYADPFGDTVAPGVTAGVDAGPALAVGVVGLAAGQTLDLGAEIASLVTPGMAGDVETISNVQAAAGQVLTVAGEGVTDYVAPSGGNDTVTFTVTDQAGRVAKGHLDIVGHAAASGTGGAGAGRAMPGDDLRATLAPGTTTTLASLLAGYIAEAGTHETLTILSATSAQHGVIDVSGAWEYVAPASGPDTITYVATDQSGAEVAGVIDVTIQAGVFADAYGDTAPPVSATGGDPGPALRVGVVSLAAGQTFDLGHEIALLVTPGQTGDTETIGNIQAVAGQVETIAGEGVTGYVAPAGGNDMVTFTVTDQAGRVAQGHLDIVEHQAAGTVGPTGTGTGAGAGKAALGDDLQVTLGHGHVTSLTTLLGAYVNEAGTQDPLTITGATAQQGSVSADAGAWDYQAPASGPDRIAYTATDQAGHAVAGVIDVTVDPGPSAQAGTITVGHGQTIDLTAYAESLISPGLPGDSTTIGSAIAALGAAHVSNASQGGPVLTYTALATGGTDTVSVRAFDQTKASVTATIAVTVDPGPTALDPAVTLGRGQFLNLTQDLASLATPGLAGDRLTLSNVTLISGTDTVMREGPDGPFVVTSPGTGTEALAYTVTDQLGDSTAGMLQVTGDPGPTVGPLAETVRQGQTVDLTAAILAAAKPGLAGDTLTLVADGTAGTAGTVALVGGDLTYTASASGSSDSFTYTVADQWGDTATGAVSVAVTGAATTIVGSPYGGDTVNGTAGTDIIVAHGYGNTINDNGGNDTVTAGDGGASVNAAGGDVTITLGGYDNTVTGGDGSDAISGSLGGSTIRLGNGADTVLLGGYGNSVSVGNGADTIVAGAGSDTVQAGSGTDNVILAGYGNVARFAGGTDTVMGGAGSDTISLAGGNGQLVLHGFGDMVFLASASATIDDLTGGFTLSLSGSAGMDVIQNAAADPSVLVELTGGMGGYQSAAAAAAALTSDGHGGAMLALGHGGGIDFAGVLPGALHASNFQIG